MKNKFYFSALTLLTLNLTACRMDTPDRSQSLNSGQLTLAVTADHEVKPLLAPLHEVSEVKQIKNPEAPRLELPTFSQFLAQKYPELLRSSKPAGATKGIGFRIEITRSETLRGIGLEKSTVLYQNALFGYERALLRLIDLAQGVFCQSEGSDKIKDGQILELMNHESQTADNDPLTRIDRLIYEPTDSSDKFILICTSRGKVPQYELEQNFKDVLRFSNAAGVFPPPGQDSIDNSDPHEEDRRRQSFKILDLEKLQKTLIVNEREDALVLVAGELMKSSEAQSKVIQGQAEEACHVSRVIGQLQNNQIYRLADTKVISADHQAQLAVLSYEYQANEQNAVNFFCFIRMNTKASEIFNVFKGVLQFGADPNP
jgi:hypothetical protein